MKSGESEGNELREWTLRVQEIVHGFLGFNTRGPKAAGFGHGAPPRRGGGERGRARERGGAESRGGPDTMERREGRRRGGGCEIGSFIVNYYCPLNFFRI